MDISELKNILENGPKALVMHQQADVDSLACALALSLAFPSCRLITPSSANVVAKRVAEHYGVDLGINALLGKEDKIIILDTSSDNQLGELSSEIMQRMSDAVVIDHHSRNPKWSPKIYITDETRNSCAEVIFGLFENMNISIDTKTAEILALGVITDTAHFRFADATTFRIFARLLERSGKRTEDILALLDVEGENDYSKKIANLKGAQRLAFKTLGKLIVATSQVSSFEAAVSKSLIILGADVSFVGAQNGENIRISGRADTAIVEKGFHIGKLLREVGEETGNLGGGHAGAAGLNGTGDAEAVLNICVEKTLAELKKLFP